MTRLLAEPGQPCELKCVPVGLRVLSPSRRRPLHSQAWLVPLRLLPMPPSARLGAGVRRAGSVENVYRLEIPDGSWPVGTGDWVPELSRQIRRA